MSKYTTKKQLHTVQSKNNPLNSFDNTFNQRQLEGAKIAQGLDMNFDSKIGYVKVNLAYGSHISFLPISDMHLATAKPEILQNINKYFKNTKTNIIHHGDMLQVSVEGHHIGEKNESLLNPQQEQLLFSEQLKEYSNKVVVATGGTHDDPEFASRLKDSYLSAIAPIYEKHNIPYFANACMVEFVAPVLKNGKPIAQTSLWCVVLHCSGKPASKKLGSAQKTLMQGMGVVERFNQEHFGNDKERYIYPDFILGGHFHASANTDYTFEKNIYDNHRITGTYVHTIHVRSGSTLQSSNSSSFNRSFPEVILPNVMQYDVHFENNPYFKKDGFNKVPKYIPVISEFPVLTNDGRFSAMAKKYTQIHRDRDYSKELKDKYKNSSAEEVYSEFAGKIV